MGEDTERPPHETLRQTQKEVVMKWESLAYLVELHAGGYLPISKTSQLGKQVRKLERIVRRNPGIDETMAARKIGIPPGGSQYRKVKYHFKLALLNGLTWVEKAHGARLKSRRDVVRQAWTGIGAARCGGAAVSEAVGHLAKRHFQRPLEGHHLFVEEAIISGMIAEHAPLRGLSSGRVRRKVDTALEQLDRMEMYLACVEVYTHSQILSETTSDSLKVADYIQHAFHNQLKGLDKSKSYLLQFYHRYLSVRQLTASGKVEEAIDCCRLATEYFDGRRSSSLGKQCSEIFANNLGRIYLENNRIGDALNYLQQVRPVEDFTAANKSVRVEFELCTQLRAGKYKDAYTAFEKLIDINQQGGNSSDLEESFAIYSGYFSMLSALGELSSYQKTSSLRLARLVNSTPLSSQEKERRNIHLIILRCLEMIRTKNELYLDYGDALRKYAYRHLRGDGLVRQSSLLKLLATIFDAGYSRSFLSQRRITKYLSLLAQNPIGKFKQHVQVELISYENVWEMVVGICDE